MGTFSIWHWLIVSLVFLPIIIAAVVVHKTSFGPERIGRRDYVVRVVGIGLLAGVIGAIDSEMTRLISFILSLVAIGLIPYWTIHRLYDMGWQNKYAALLVTIPLLGLFFFIYVACIPSFDANMGTHARAQEIGSSANEENRPAMKANVKTGLFRLWIVISALWMVFIIVMALSERRGPEPGIFLAFLLLPPLGTLALFKAGEWVWTGFKGQR